MTQNLDLSDIQGNILQEFVGGFPIARFIFLRIRGADAGSNDKRRQDAACRGRNFVLEYRSKITTELRWGSSGAYTQPIYVKEQPKVAINIAFTYEGLRALGLPTRTLAKMPPEFMDGMKARSAILGDNDDGAGWDRIWREQEQGEQRLEEEKTGSGVHIMIGLNAQSASQDVRLPVAVPELELETQYLQQLCVQHQIDIVAGHGPSNAPWQDAAAIRVKNGATYKFAPIEHFGYVDGISNPVFEGQFGSPYADEIMAIGNGKLLPGGKWAPLATGEFLVGHPDEAQETPDAALPVEVMRNGTFLVYRKLHENVASFKEYITKTAMSYAQIMGVSQADAEQIIKAKMAGRWQDGIPLSRAPTIEKWRQLQLEFLDYEKRRQENPELGHKFMPLVDFTYGDDPEGSKCPVTSHTRRTNTRDGLTRDSSSTLNNRRRILRRGIPYGASGTPEDDADEREHGIIFIALCASLSRQFEFVQQQWINYGLDANAGNDTCPLVGVRDTAKFVIPVDPDSDKAPFICDAMPSFVETRGGEYFFMPSMTALRMIGMGTVDPT